MCAECLAKGGEADHMTHPCNACRDYLTDEKVDEFFQVRACGRPVPIAAFGAWSKWAMLERMCF